MSTSARRTTSAWATPAAATLVVVLGAVLRWRSLTPHGLFQDDAWVALTGRLPFATALHVAGTAPGFVALLHPLFAHAVSNPHLAELPALVAGLVGLAATPFVLTRLGLGRAGVLAGTLVVACSPVAVATAGHVKPYTLDFLDALVVLVVARRCCTRPTARRAWWFTGVSIVTVLLSASVLPVVVGAWAVTTGTARRAPREVLAALAATPLGLVLLIVTCFSHLPTALNRYWASSMLTPKPLSTLPHRASGVLRGLTTGLLPTTTKVPAEVTVTVVIVAVLVVVGLVSGRRTVGVQLAAATLVVATCLAVGGKVPLGTGRTDMGLYPALALVLTAGVESTWTWLQRSSVPAMARCTLAVAIVAAVAGLGLVAQHPYAATDLAAFRHGAPACGTARPITLVDAYTRYPWALTESPRFAIARDPGYGAGFTVSWSSTALVEPAQPYEAHYAPDRWAIHAADVTRRVAGRGLLMVETPPTGHPHADRVSAELERLGFTPSWTRRAATTTETCFIDLRRR